MSGGFWECLKRERDIIYIKPKLRSVKTGFRITPALTTSFSRNPICYQHRAKIYREIHKFNRSARIINENSDFITLQDENKLSTKTSLRLVESKKMPPTCMGGKELNITLIQCYSHYERGGAPSCWRTGEVGLCRDSAPSNSTP